MPRGRPWTLDLFLEHLNKNGPIKRPELGPCWEWLGYRDANGYGNTQYLGRPIRIHRLSIILHGLPLGAAQDACHRCDNPPCGRPDHLVAGTTHYNVVDMRDKARMGNATLRPGEADVIRTALATGATQMATAQRFGLSQSQVSEIARGRSWGTARRSSIARRPHMTEDDVREIRRLRAEGLPASAIAARFRRDISQIRNIVSGRQWAHLT